jgi:hypothetical protein
MTSREKLKTLIRVVPICITSFHRIVWVELTKFQSITDLLRIPKGDSNYRYREYRNFLKRPVFADLLEKSATLKG